MALQIWLPLNKEEIVNQGLADITITNNGATYNSNGKIGGCYKVNGAQLLIPSASYMEMKSGKQFSFACWAKGATSSGWFIACSGWEIQFQTGHINVYPGGASGNRDSNFSGATAVDQWRHIAFTWDGSNLILYVDGNAQNTSTFNVSYNISSNIKFCYQGERYLNDIRIYDHCLSPKEVKELSKGLILHYPLNDEYSEGTTNILSYSNLQGHGSSWTLQTETFRGTPIYKNVVTSPNSGNNAGFSFRSSIAPSGLNTATKVTLSFYKRLNTVYGRNLGGYLRVIKSDSSAATYGWSYNKSNWANDSNSIGKWEYITATVTIPSGCTSISHFYVYTDQASGGDCDFAQIQLEFKDHATPYTDGTRTGVVYDSSGYKNNGIVIGTLTLSNNAPRYDKGIGMSCAGYNQGVQYNYLRSNISIANPTELTIAFWFKGYNRYHGGVFCTSSGDHFQDYQQTAIHDFDSYIACKTSNALYNLSSSNWIINGTWHHYAITYDGSNFKMYRDSSLIQTVSGTGTLTTFNYISFNYSCAGGGKRGINGAGYSDCRLYTTALSVDDIKALYQEAAFIDHKGNVGCYQFYEDGENSKELWPTPTSGVTYNDDGSYTITGQKSAYSTLIPIDSSKTFYYDVEYSNLNAGSYFLIGFERYDIDKQTVSNQGCQYVTTTRNAELHTRKVGTITFSAVNGNPAAFTRLRILNHWTGSTSDSPSDSKAVIYHISLKEVSAVTENQINKQGQVRSDLFIESEDATIGKYGTITGNQLIEI